jgi:hypothetical protein
MLELCSHTPQVLYWLMTGLSIGTAAGFFLSALIQWMTHSRD